MKFFAKNKTKFWSHIFICGVALLFQSSGAENGNGGRGVTKSAFIDDNLDGSGNEDKPLIVTLPTNYSVHLPPPLINGEPVPVYFSILLFNVFDIKEIQGELSLETNLKIYWKDTRLANLTGSSDHKYIVLNPLLVTQIWHPDAFIDHMKGMNQPSLISKAASLRIYPDGSLRYSARMIINLSCRMDFYFYPADTQKCHWDIKSYAYSTKFLTLSWKDDKGPEMAYPIDVHNFDVALDTAPDYLQNTRSASYSAIGFNLYLRRKLSYHIIQTFIPSGLFTIVSWLSFLVPPESTPGRMALCVTTLLTLTAMFASVRQNTPSVSYVKALDIWMVTCIVFVFAVLAEYTTVLKLRSMKEKEKKSKMSHPHNLVIRPGQGSHKTNPTGMGVELTSLSSPTGSSSTRTSPSPQLMMRQNFALDFEGSDKSAAHPLIALSRPVTPATAPTPTPDADKDKKPTKYFRLACKFEKYTPRIMPVCFLIFTIIYWPYLLIRSDYYKLKQTEAMYYSI